MIMLNLSAATAAISGSTEHMLFTIDTKTTHNDNDEIARAKADEAAMEDLIRRHRRFILSCAYKATHRFITESDDEWSIALIAFHEAVMSYDNSRGSFRSFAALVIRRRLLDHLDSQAKTRREISTDFDESQSDDTQAVSGTALEARQQLARQAIDATREQTQTRDEIDAMQQILGGYGFSFFDLADCSPRAQKTKAACAAVITALLDDRELIDSLRRTGTLPTKKLVEVTGLPRKILENHRKYIIAAAEILDGDYPHLAEYLRFVKKGSDTL